MSADLLKATDHAVGKLPPMETTKDGLRLACIVEIIEVVNDRCIQNGRGSLAKEMTEREIGEIYSLATRQT